VAVAVLLSIKAVSVIAFELRFESAALFIVTTPLKLSAFSAFVMYAKDGVRLHEGFYAQFGDFITT
jgi:hypothetical protein